MFHIDPRRVLPKGIIGGGISTRFGFQAFALLTYLYLIRACKVKDWDLAWIDCGAEIPPGFHRWLKQRGTKIVNYNVDDPFSRRDGRKWDLYKRSVPFHDLTVVVRKENIEEAKLAGAKQVELVYRSYDPVAHAPVAISAEERREFGSDIIFVGSWMPERGPFMARLLELGVPLTIRGERWHKAVEWPRIKEAWKGPAAWDREYVASIQCAKIALGLLSVGNRDLHTTRSAEIPYIGGAAFCAQRTREHQNMFKEGEEALFWSSPDECSNACLAALNDESHRKKMVTAAREKILHLKLSNDEVMTKILTVLSEGTIDGNKPT